MSKALIDLMCGVSILLILLYIILNVSSEYILIDGNDVIEYEIVDGNTIIIHTENEKYKVELYDDVVDFTVNSNITIELTRESIFGNPVDDFYFINRIIKIPEVIV